MKQILSDSQWEIISKCLDTERNRQINLRDVVCAILYVLRTGIQWRLLPPNYPKWSAVYYYFNKWKKDETVSKINQFLNEMDREKSGSKALPSLLNADSQSVKLTPMIFEDRGIDGNKKVNGRKRHILVDTGGRIWAAHCHAANIADSIGGIALLEQIQPIKHGIEKIITDSGYRGEFAICVQNMGIKFEVAAVPPSSIGFVPLKNRWVVERTFAWTNFYRRVAKDFEHTVENSAIWLIWMNISIIKNRIAV